MKAFVIHQIINVLCGIVLWLAGLVFSISGIGFIVTWFLELSDKMELFKMVAIRSGIVWIVFLVLIILNLIIVIVRAARD